MTSYVSRRITTTALRLAEEGRLPDPILVAGIRRMLRTRLGGLEGESTALDAPGGAIALEPAAANQQHYELPVDFFRRILGPHLKYSCCRWEDGARTLAEAELSMLELTADRAKIGEGQSILDLGCGWGSFSLFAARKYPSARLLAVSNSRVQVEFIRREACRRNLANVDAQLADANVFSPTGRFDRVVSIEMMEHVHNHAELLRRISSWLVPGGRLFVHVFCHREHAYPFVGDGPADWMARRFFTGGMMPSPRTIPEAARGHLASEATWTVSGKEYERTAAVWLENLDSCAPTLRNELDGVGDGDPQAALNRWRLFFLAVRETFGFEAGGEWQVLHHLLRSEGIDD